MRKRAERRCVLPENETVWDLFVRLCFRAVQYNDTQNAGNDDITYLSHVKQAHSDAHTFLKLTSLSLLIELLQVLSDSFESLVDKYALLSSELDEIVTQDKGKENSKDGEKESYSADQEILDDYGEDENNDDEDDEEEEEEEEEDEYNYDKHTENSKHDDLILENNDGSSSYESKIQNQNTTYATSLPKIVSLKPPQKPSTQLPHAQNKLSAQNKTDTHQKKHTRRVFTRRQLLLKITEMSVFVPLLRAYIFPRLPLLIPDILDGLIEQPEIKTKIPHTTRLQLKGLSYSYVYCTFFYILFSCLKSV